MTVDVITLYFALLAATGIGFGIGWWARRPRGFIDLPGRDYRLDPSSPAYRAPSGETAGAPIVPASGPVVAHVPKPPVSEATIAYAADWLQSLAQAAGRPLSRAEARAQALAFLEGAEEV